jgi:hypothetical protein
MIKDEQEMQQTVLVAERNEHETNDAEAEAVLRTGVKPPKQKQNAHSIANSPHQGAE